MRWPPPRLRASTWAYLAVALMATAPAWIVKHPPLQDLPFHLATIRVIRSFHDPAYAFDHYFRLVLGRTQYIIYYLVGAFLALFVGVVGANVVLVSICLGGTVLALRDLLRALGRDERLCLLVVPLLFNTMFIYGLLPFSLAIPLTLWGVAVAVRHFDRPSLASGALLGVLGLAIFYSHVLPFGLFCIAYAALFPWTRPERWVKSAAPAVPVALVLLWWSSFTAAGRLARGAALDSGADPRRPLDAAIADLPNWFANIFRDSSDEALIVALAFLVVASLGLSLGDPARARSVARAYVLVPLACIVCYFIFPEGHGYIWLIAQRFPILFAITAIPLVRMPRGQRGVLVTAAAATLALASVVNTCRHFIRFEIDDVGGIDQAIDVMQPGRKVCALIYDKGSTVVNNQPFMHFGSYYQVRKGGVVMFTYAGYAHWPIDFLPGHYPPPGGPARLRWEWMPEAVPMTEIYPYYDYVLTRGAGFRPPPGTYTMKWRDAHWAVWERVGS